MIEAIAIAPGYTNSAIASASYTINVILQAATPTFSIAAGTYTSTQTVAIADTTSAAVIYYTLDGSTPTTASTKYATPIAVSSSETIEAIAIATGYTTSSVATASYIIVIPATVATPVLSPAAGTYTSVQTITITDSTSGAAIYYTTDGSTPTTASTKYSAPLIVNSTETVEALAIAPGATNSAVASAVYTINLPAATFTLAASPSTATVTAGNSATFMLTVTPQNNFVQTITFSCPGLSSSLQCTFAPATVTPASAPVNSTLTVTTSSTSADARPIDLRPWNVTAGVITTALLLWPYRRRRWQKAVVLSLLFLMAGIALTGCSTNNFVSKSQTYTVNVTATGGGVSQSSTISLTATN